MAEGALINEAVAGIRANKSSVQLSRECKVPYVASCSLSHPPNQGRQASRPPSADSSSTVTDRETGNKLGVLQMRESAFQIL